MGYKSPTDQTIRKLARVLGVEIEKRGGWYYLDGKAYQPKRMYTNLYGKIKRKGLQIPPTPKTESKGKKPSKKELLQKTADRLEEGLIVEWDQKRRGYVVEEDGEARDFRKTYTHLYRRIKKKESRKVQ